MFGSLLQSPALISPSIFAVPRWVYVRQAKSKERESVAGFGQEYEQYCKLVPAFTHVFGRPQLKSGVF
jgi:protein-S-isoprenylcysteine O-methyltransferase Ste14